MPDLIVSRDASTGEPIGELAETDAEVVDATAQRAQDALRGEWSRQPKARARAMNAWADALEANIDDLTSLLTRETGKITAQARGEFVSAADALRFNAGLARQLGGASGPLSDGSISYIERQPIGVSAFIMPWNAPVSLLFRDLGPALAAGCTAVVKPSPFTSLITQRVLEIGGAAGVPDGVLNAVFGGAAVGTRLIEHPHVRIVAFTGSTETGRAIMRTAAGDFTRVLLELGGKSASIIFADADIDRALTTCLRSAFSINGQYCMANSRLLVSQPVYARVLADVTDRVAALRVGPPGTAGTDVGPLISHQQRDRIMGYVDLARVHDNVVIGGKPVDVDGLPGAFFAPTVLAGDDIDTRLLSEEIFGPVVTVEPFGDEAEAIRLANMSPYGLAGSVWTRDVGRAWRVARSMDAGTIWVNRYGNTFPEAPSGGFKQSGVGRTRGIDGLHTFTEVKHVNWDVPSAGADGTGQ